MTYAESSQELTTLQTGIIGFVQEIQHAGAYT